jgi:hypothetical protein
MKMNGQHHAPAALPTERNAVPIQLDAGWAPGPIWTFWRREKSASVEEVRNRVNVVAILLNQRLLDAIFLVCLLGANASTCFGRYSSIFRRFSIDAVWCNYVRRMCVD